jgi:hypothetical protein
VALACGVYNSHPTNCKNPFRAAGAAAARFPPVPVPVPVPAARGRFLVRSSDSLFFSPQSDLEKKQNAVRRGLAKNAQIRGVFGSPPWAEDFFDFTGLGAFIPVCC